MNTDRKNVIWNMIGATTSAFNSLFFVIIATRTNGLSQAGIFSYGYATACILFVLGSYVVRAFQVTDTSGDFSDTDYFFNRFISCGVMIVLSLIFILVKGYSPFKATVLLLLCLYKCLDAFAEVLYGAVQKRERLYQVGISLFIKAILSVVLFLLVDILTHNLLISCVSLVVVYALVIFFYDVPNVKRISFSHSPFSLKKVMLLFRSCFFTFALTILITYLINAPRYAIDDLLDDSAQTIYGIIILPATFMCLLGLYIIQPLLTKISAALVEKNYLKLRKMVIGILALMVILGVVVFTVAYFLEVPVLSLIYGTNLKPYKLSMMIIIAGSVMYGLQTIMSNILISFRKTGIQALFLAIDTSIVTYASYKIIPSMKIDGASIIYFCGMTAIAVSLFICLIIFMLKYKKSWKLEGTK